MGNPFDLKAQSPFGQALRIDQQREMQRVQRPLPTALPVTRPPKGKVGSELSHDDMLEFIKRVARLMGDTKGKMLVPNESLSSVGAPISDSRGMGIRGQDNPLNQLPDEFYDDQHYPGEGPNHRMQPIYDMYEDPNQAGPKPQASLPKPQGRFLVQPRST